MNFGMQQKSLCANTKKQTSVCTNVTQQQEQQSIPFDSIAGLTGSIYIIIVCFKVNWG